MVEIQEDVEVYEERHYLIRAKDQVNANSIGQNLGRENEHSYQNVTANRYFGNTKSC